MSLKKKATQPYGVTMFLSSKRTWFQPFGVKKDCIGVHLFDNDMPASHTKGLPICSETRKKKKTFSHEKAQTYNIILLPYSSAS